MSDPLVVTTLRKKREEITAAIKAYDKRLAQAKRDLGHINAVIQVFEASGDPGGFPVHVNTRTLFQRREISTICKAILSSEGPMDILSARLAKLASRPHDSLALERKRPTKSQGEMPSAKARRRNVLGAFRVPPAKVPQVKGRNILLVDDVFTTGATLDACARALKRAGAARVDALTLARVVRERSSDI